MIDEAELALAQVAADIIESVSMARAMELAAGLPGPGAREWRHLGPLALGHAEAANPDLPATPDRPGKHYCDICGCADENQIEPGPDKDTFGADKAAWMCTDANARACEARARHRYPPRPDLVPDAVLAALSATDEAHARLRQQQAPVPPAGQQEPAGEQQQYTPPGWSAATANGAWDVHGTWHPPVVLPPQWHPTSHLISGGAPMSHAISGGTQHMGHTISGTRRQLPPVPPPAQEAQDGAQGAQHQIPPTGLSPGTAEALRGGVGHDIQTTPPELPEGSPQRPARSRRRSRMPQYGGRRR